MAISRYCATQYKHKWIGNIYTLRTPDCETIFYVGKTQDRKLRYGSHISEAKSANNNFVNKEKKLIISSFLDEGKLPVMGIIETIPIRTNYDNLFYDYREMYFIRKYIEYGWNLVNIRIDRGSSYEQCYKNIKEMVSNRGGLNPSDFYYGTDHKGFPIYDLKRIESLGYCFSSDQYASHWSYIIETEKYKDIPETTLDYSYSDIPCEENINKDFYDF